jgi:DNA-binding response OmpR family regulator
MRDLTFSGKKRILCAEGHQDTCLLVSCLLGPAGYEVTTVNDMTSGLRIARTAIFGLYLIADKLTEGTGIELCEKVREVDRETPILFWSARVYESDRQCALDAGANVFLRKPCDYDAILTIVSQLVDESKPSQPTSSGKLGLLEKRRPYSVSRARSETARRTFST